MLDSTDEYCTKLGPRPDLISSTEVPGASDTQIAALQLLANASYLFDLQTAELRLNASSLVNTYLIPSLPDDQWINEILGWERLIWASLQTTVSDYAVGYTTKVPRLDGNMKRNMSKGERELCNVQRMVKPGGLV